MLCRRFEAFCVAVCDGTHEDVIKLQTTTPLFR